MINLHAKQAYKLLIHHEIIRQKSDLQVHKFGQQSDIIAVLRVDDIIARKYRDIFLWR
jgi:hypothetical protein